MATETFTWCPQIDPVGEVQHRTLRAQFGDGYAQVAADGINARSESWPLSFTGRLTTIAPLREFPQKSHPRIPPVTAHHQRTETRRLPGFGQPWSWPQRSR